MRPGSAGALPPPPDTRLPDGCAVHLGDVFRSRDGRLMLGGSPPRLIRLTTWAARQLDGGVLTVSGPAPALLVRREAAGAGYLLLRLLDDLAYGAGVWAGAVRQRTAGPLLPRLTGTGPARELSASRPDQAD